MQMENIASELISSWMAKELQQFQHSFAGKIEGQTSSMMENYIKVTVEMN